MLFLEARNISFSIGNRELFSVPELLLYRGNRVGLVGRNGEGKTVLLRSLMHKEDTGGSVNHYGKVHYFNQLNAELPSHTHTLSGGEKTKLKLEQLFSKKADVLLLDEPTNNLDVSNIEELEKILLSFKGAILIASHDRALLDRLCNEIWELDQGKLTIYKGNYLDYQKQKRVEEEQKWEAFESYTKEKKRLLEAYRRKVQQSQQMDTPSSRMGNSEWQLYKGHKSGKRGKVESVSKHLRERMERLEKVDKPLEWDSLKMELTNVSKIHRRHLIMAKEVTKTFGSRKLYSIPSLKLKTGSKTALIGSNGSGKTTLIQQIIQSEEGMDVSNAARIGYFQQELEALPSDKTILEFVKESSSLPMHVIRIILGRLRFREEEVHKPIGVLSGGERVKTAIAKLLTGEFNFLILDEPTNHLDYEAIEALEALLKDYTGTVLFITHDRRFIEHVADHLWILKDQTVHYFHGTYEQWINRDGLSFQKEQATNMEEKIKLENRLADVLSRISMPSPKDDLLQLEVQYKEILQKLKSV